MPHATVACTCDAARGLWMQNRQDSVVKMTDDAVLPAAKLQKSTVGDVTEGKAMDAITHPQQVDQSSIKVNQDATNTAAGSASVTPDAGGPTGGKKRKVALYIAYIGAGYYVSV